ncbi:MAG: hypothetical protein J7521_19665 [Caulobacter sp.]|nr:hypothetical protein [Caulobacter sp.]
MRSFVTIGAAALALAVSAPAFAQTQDPAAPQAPATTPAPAPVTAGQPVKDSTGAVIGSVAEVKPDAAGKSMATIKMDDKTFAVDVANLAVADGATLINATKAELEGMLGVKK